MRVIVFLLCMIPFTAWPNEPLAANGQSIGLNAMGGRIFMHTPKIYTKAPPFSGGVEFSFQQQTDGRRDWHQRFGFPELGLHVFYAQHGSAQLGHSISLYPTIQFRLLRLPQGYCFLKFGGGLGYANRHWQRLPSEDTLVNIIGSHVNNFTMFQIGARHFFSYRLSAQAGLHFYHLSNAAARSPNFGINTYGGFLGVNYHLQPALQHFTHRRLARMPNPLNIALSGSLAFAEDKTPDGPVYPVYTGSLALYKMYRNKSRVFLGSDLIYSSKARSFIRNTNQQVNGRWLSPIQYTAFLGHEFLFGKIGFPLTFGVYLNRPVGGQKIYQKLGMNYHFLHVQKGPVKDGFISLILKTHMIQAQYAELGFGFFL